MAIVHVGISGILKAPEMALDDAEAKSLAAATANVLEQFDIQPDPKIEAIIGLVTVAGMIYAPRVYLIRERKKVEAQTQKEKRERENNPFGNMPINPGA